MNTVSDTVAAIYNLSDFHIGFLGLDVFSGYFSGPATIGIFSDLKILSGFLSLILAVIY